MTNFVKRLHHLPSWYSCCLDICGSTAFKFFASLQRIFKNNRTQIHAEIMQIFRFAQAYTKAIFCKYFTWRLQSRQEMTHVSEWGCDLLQHITSRQLHRDTHAHTNSTIALNASLQKASWWWHATTNRAATSNRKCKFCVVQTGCCQFEATAAWCILPVGSLIMWSRVVSVPLRLWLFCADTCRGENDEDVR